MSEIFDIVLDSPTGELEENTVPVLAEGSIEGFGSWTLGEDGLLVVKGKGDMPDWKSRSDDSDAVPWRIYCKQIKEVHLSTGITRIGSCAFMSCSELTRIEIPDGITTIAQWTFFCCNSLVNVTIPGSVTNIGREAFFDCSSLTHIDIPNGVTVLASGTFSGCTSLSRITIPSSVTVIGFRAFNYCESLTQITIPNSVIQFERYWGVNEAFLNCTSLQRVYMPRRFNRMFFERYYGISKNIVTFY